MISSGTGRGGRILPAPFKYEARKEAESTEQKEAPSERRWCILAKRWLGRERAQGFNILKQKRKISTGGRLMTNIGDVVLVYMDDNPAFFARVEEISTDVKPGWFQVKFLVLQVPLLVVTWILREAYYNGDEFTMGGRPMRVEKVVTPTEGTSVPEAEREGLATIKPELVSPAKKKPGTGQQGKVISLADRLKKERD